MTTRRSFLQAVGFGSAAVAAAPVARTLDAPAESLRAFANGTSDAAEPWWLFAPLSPGAPAGLGWSLAALSPVERGAAVLTLQHHDGRSARVHVCAHAGAPRGIAHSALFDLLLMDGRTGAEPTPESLGRVLVGLAARLRKNELSEGAPVHSVARLLTHAERVRLYGPESLT